MRRYGWILVASFVWTTLVWVTRIGIVLRQGSSAGFRIVHAVLIVGSLGFGAAVGWVGLKLLRSTSLTDARP